MDPGGYLAGTLFLLAAAGAVGFAAVRICARRLPLETGPVRAVGFVLLSGSLLAFSVLLPGALGILTRGTFLGTAALIALLAALIGPVRGGEPAPRGAPAAREAAELDGAPLLRRWLLPGTATFVLAAWLIAELLTLAVKPPLAVDFTSYDLPIIGRWIQSGSVWHLTELFPLQTHGTYPQTADLLLAAFVLPFHNDALVTLAPFLAIPVTGLACFCTARELQAPRPTAALLAAVFCAIPTVAWEVKAGPPDALALAAFSAGILFLVRHARLTRSSELVLAGLGLGFAAGSLWYFSSAVVLLAVVWIVTVLRPGGPAGAASWRQTVARAGLLVGVIAAVSGFWLIRNLVDTGDPFYPVRIAVAGQTIFAAPPDLYRAVSGFSIADYLGSPHVLGHYIVPALTKAAGLPGLLLLVGLGWVAWRSGRSIVRRARPASLPLALLLGSVLLAVLYVVTPYSAFGYRGRPALAWINVRYLIPAMAVALAALAAAAASTNRRLRTLLELAACTATIEGVVATGRLLGTRAVFLPIGGAVVFVVAGGAWLRLRGPRHDRLSSATRAAVLAASLAVLVALGYGEQRKANATRYAGYDSTFAWIQKHPAPLAVGLAGSFNFHGISPAWPMFGERIQNRVAFVGPFRRGHLTQYSSRQAWLRGVRRGRYDVLEIALNRPPPDTSDNEPRWAAQSGFPVLARSYRLELVRVPR